MSDYKYVCPTENGYKPFTIKWKTFVEIVPTRKGRRFTKVKGYLKDGHIILHYVPTLTGCILSTLLFPAGVLLEGTMNYKDIWQDMVVKTWYAEEKGSFSGDDIYKKRGDTFDKLLSVAKFREEC